MLDYSENEYKLLQHFGYSDLIAHQPMIVLYRMCAEKAFLEKMEGPPVEALRRGLRAMIGCKPWRNTPAFKKLIEF